MGEKVIMDLDHAREVARDTVDVEWDSKIKHSEPKVIVACAVIVNAYAETLDEVTAKLNGLIARVDELYDFVGYGR